MLLFSEPTKNSVADFCLVQSQHYTCPFKSGTTNKRKNMPKGELMISSKHTVFVNTNYQTKNCSKVVVEMRRAVILSSSQQQPLSNWSSTRGAPVTPLWLQVVGCTGKLSVDKRQHSRYICNQLFSTEYIFYYFYTPGNPPHLLFTSHTSRHTTSHSYC